MLIMREISELFRALGRSKFRSGFRLSSKDVKYLQEKGVETILEHARDFIITRLAQAAPANDGRQTPMKNHPVFIAQHATASCCRRCLEKWHYIARGKALTEQQIGYILSVIEYWLKGRGF